MSGAHIDEDVFGQILHFGQITQGGDCTCLVGRGRGIVAHSRLLHVNFMSKGSQHVHLRTSGAHVGKGVGGWGHGSVHVLGVGAGCM